MAADPNTLDHVRRLANFEQRLEYVLGMDDTQFDDLEVFMKLDHDPLSRLDAEPVFRFDECADEYAAVIVGAKVHHLKTSSDRLIAGYEGFVYQLCKGRYDTDLSQDHLIGIIVAQSTGVPLDVSELMMPGKLEKEIMYMQKVFRKMGLPELSEKVSVYIDSCFF